MKRLTAEETTIITSTETTMAATITSMCFASPTAVNTESSENTMSMSADLDDDEPQRTQQFRTLPLRRLAVLQHAANFHEALHHQKQAAAEQDQVASGDVVVRPR